MELCDEIHHTPEIFLELGVETQIKLQPEKFDQGSYCSVPFHAILGPNNSQCQKTAFFPNWLEKVPNQKLKKNMENCPFFDRHEN